MTHIPNYRLYQLLLLLFAFCVTSCRDSSEVTKDATPPNVLFILADDLGYSDLSCMGSDFYETPNIDRIAAMGARFTEGYANCQVCSPSRASLLTGQSPVTHGITDWIGAATGEAWRGKNRYTKLLPPDYRHELPAEATTLPEAFRAAGYHTFFAGKWHLGGKDSWPTRHGFDINVGGHDAGSPRGGYFDPYTNPNLSNRQPGENLSLRLARETADFISSRKDSSFFAYLSFYAVHGPIQSTREKWEKYRLKALEQGAGRREGFAMERILPARLHQDHPVYAGLVEQMDDAVGVVLDTLEALGLLDNTIIVFTSDNGGVVSGDGYATNLAPLRGGKGYQFEGGIKVPYLLYAPGKTTPGSTPTARVIGTDLYPTLLELAGLPAQPDAHRDGRSLTGILNGDTLPSRDLVWHYPHYGNQGGEPSSILRRDDYKLIYYYESDKSELYHLPTDPSEQHNLANEEPKRVELMEFVLMEHLQERGARFPEADPEFDPLAHQKVLDGYRSKRWPQLENTRKQRLRADWSPDKDWWGSQTTID